MNLRKAIGIDPDSQKIVCVLVDPIESTKKVLRNFNLTKEGLEKFITWIFEVGDVIIALEGLNGQSRPIENILRKHNLVFYSFKPSDIIKFRDAVLGKNKTNKLDAEAVARFAITAEGQDNLKRYRRVWFPDSALQNLTREHQRLTKKMSVEISTLWKALKSVSSDLYLFLGGNHPDSEMKSNILKQQGILTLLSGSTDVSEWKNMSDEEMLEAMGGQRYKNRDKLIIELKKIVSNIYSVSMADMLIVKNIVNRLLLDKSQRLEVTKMIEQVTEENESVKELKKIHGIGIVTAAIIIAETVDIRRFVNDDRYASYSGFGMNQRSTGDESKFQKLVHTRNFNHRLKNAYMTAAKNVVLHNPELHIAGYFKNLRKKGFSIIEARKRVARALLRTYFKILQAVHESKETKVVEEKELNRTGVASGQDRSGNPTISNTPHPAMS